MKKKTKVDFYFNRKLQKTFKSIGLKIVKRYCQKKKLLQQTHYHLKINQYKRETHLGLKHESLLKISICMIYVLFL